MNRMDEMELCYKYKNSPKTCSVMKGRSKIQRQNQEESIKEEGWEQGNPRKVFGQD